MTGVPPPPAASARLESLLSQLEGRMTGGRPASGESALLRDLIAEIDRYLGEVNVPAEERVTLRAVRQDASRILKDEARQLQEAVAGVGFKMTSKERNELKRRRRKLRRQGRRVGFKP